MLEFVLEKMTESGKFKNSTITSLKYIFLRISRNVYNKEDMTEEELYDTKKILSFISKKYSSEKKKLANSYRNFLIYTDANDNLIQEITEYCNNVNRTVDFERAYAEPSEKEKNNFLSFDQVVKIRDGLREQLLHDKYIPHYDIRYILLSLYTNLPPLRQIEYCDAVFKDGDEEPECNYIDLDKKIFIVKHHKMDKKMGVRKVELPDNLVEDLINFKNKSGSKNLLPQFNNVNLKLSSQGVTDTFRSIFKRPIGPMMLRKIYISKNVIDKNLPSSERKKIAQIMGHTPATQQLIYSKFSEILHPDLDLSLTPEEKKEEQKTVYVKCPQCDKEFSKNYLRRHVLKEHKRKNL